MASRSNKLLSALVSVCVLAFMQVSVDGAPSVPCYFIFGDSLADNGNNNPLITLAKANYPPYGIDFRNRTPTGRFCNGLTTADIIGQLLGLTTLITPFTAATGSAILQGMNYASASAGIRLETGEHLGKNIGFHDQILNHWVTMSRIKALLKSPAAAEAHLNKCIYYVGIGSNDYINNYFQPKFYNSSTYFDPEQYAENLVDRYSLELTTLYNSGARKFALFGVGRIGCTPSALSTTKGGVCVKAMNDAARIFNAKLKSQVDKWNRVFKDATFMFVDVFGIGLGDPRHAGFKILNVGCCPVDKLGRCALNGNPCPNRKEYVFWDSFHPTEALNQIIAKRSFNALNPSDTYPIDISHLAQLKLSSLGA